MQHSHLHTFLKYRCLNWLLTLAMSQWYGVHLVTKLWHVSTLLGLYCYIIFQLCVISPALFWKDWVNIAERPWVSLDVQFWEKSWGISHWHQCSSTFLGTVWGTASWCTHTLVWTFGSLWFLLVLISSLKSHLNFRIHKQAEILTDQSYITLQRCHFLKS